ncbi:MAG: HU family DNA-binding protein [Holosporales bacterium]|jgi:DNA-binding protein HU-beta|nr:HU family DNA-binding protein [Holosporales bacterium]
MNRVELVANIANISGLKKIEAEKALSAFIETVTSELSRGEEIRLVGFGIFSVTHRNATEGRNMKTGEPMRIPARDLPKFKPGKQLKEMVAKKGKR